MSSSESDNEELKKFAESLDSTVFSNKLYGSEPQEKVSKENESEKNLKSQRHLDIEENVFHSEINVSSSMQKFIGDKLSKLIENRIELIEVKMKKNQNNDSEIIDNVRLLSGCTEPVKYLEEPDDINVDRKKIPIKRRIIEEEELSDTKKIELAASNLKNLEEEVNQWDRKTKKKPFEYKNKNGIGYLKEELNEFTKIRNKNNWNESKIKSNKFHNSSMCDTVKKKSI
ncbi:CLUMA_CG011210, isoform A [Clunio marinus]|uniref:CLUMA_CG011210, isoform A n=1 Tax=Clunio marinus TaxID=568069 RepID=A0A1J1IDJ9_9DIPT|nr:CLUMA_CG011210, isoform A [Clunio marinus]